MSDIKVELWDEIRFNSAEKEWSDLLARSNSDRLFMSWEWLSTWWHCFGTKGEMKLQLFAAYDNNILVGLAPLFLTSAVSKKFVKTARLQFLGNIWRGDSTMRTELLDFIVDREFEDEIIRTLFNSINEQPDWDEFILSESNTNSKTYQLLVNEKLIGRSYYRYAETYKSYFLKVVGSFEKYCGVLGKNTRLKFINRRKLLEKLGDVAFYEYSGGAISDYFDILNSLHLKRWGRPVFEGERLEFNYRVAQLLSKKDQLSFSMILFNDKPISIQYNYTVNKHTYNIQAGFDEDFHNKISLGYLHFGYAVELCFKNKMDVYDFLAGEGKNTQYKERLTSTSEEIVCMQLVRSNFVKFLYIIFDRFCDVKKKLMFLL